jgi:hypothetical protein
MRQGQRGEDLEALTVLRFEVGFSDIVGSLMAYLGRRRRGALSVDNARFKSRRDGSTTANRTCSLIIPSRLRFAVNPNKMLGGSSQRLTLCGIYDTYDGNIR